MKHQRASPASTSTCPACGAGLAPGSDRCPFCDSWLRADGTPPRRSARAVSRAESLPELGLGPLPLALMSLVTLVLSLGGWLLERPGTYWSSDGAIAVWCGLVPLWTLLTGALWRRRESRWLGALACFILSALPFLSVVALRKGRLDDDALGLSIFVGGCAALAFSVGLLLNYRWSRKKASLLRSGEPRR